MSSVIHSPQLVTGMLPENGGGHAVAVSASENHTAVLTDTGALFTWGATHGKNILGHPGVSWQPDPKRVPGVYRAVGVAAAKEHTVLLVGATFPPIPSISSNPQAETLETLAARTIAKQVDLFNVLPVYTMAERTQSKLLLQYCAEFVKRNLDGVLNVAQKSVIDIFLNEQLRDRINIEEPKDSRHHPLLIDFVTAGRENQKWSFESSFGGSTVETLSNVDDWLIGCKALATNPIVSEWMQLQSTLPPFDFDDERYNEEDGSIVGEGDGKTRGRSRSLSTGSDNGSMKSPLFQKNKSGCSDRCLELTRNMDLSTRELTEAKQMSISKELRAVRKKLGQIDKLEEITKSDMQDVNDSSTVLTTEQLEKIARRPQLEADLKAFEPALEIIEIRLKALALKEKQAREEAELERRKREQSKDKEKESLQKDAETAEEPSEPPKSYRCELCKVNCPDKTSYELHINGRKHRNRMLQDEEEKRASAAAAIMEQKERQKRLTRSDSKGNSSASKVWKTEPSVPAPTYKLPPPPHPVPDSIATTSTPSKKNQQAKSLTAIMQEETRKLNLTANVAKAGSPMQKKSLTQIMQEEQLKLKIGRKPPASPSLKQFPSPAAAKTLKSSPWSTPKAKPAPVAFAAATTPSLSSTPPPGKYSLVDFLNPAPKPAKKAAAPWLSPQKPTTNVSSSPGLSLKDIQQQEEDFKSKEDQACATPGSWYIERRERAGSFLAIQDGAEQKREEERMLQEQLAIEKQIMEELAKKKKQEEQAAAKTSKKKPQNGRNRKNNNKNNNNNNKKKQGDGKNGGAPNKPGQKTNNNKNKKNGNEHPNSKGGKKKNEAEPGNGSKKNKKKNTTNNNNNLGRRGKGNGPKQVPKPQPKE